MEKNNQKMFLKRLKDRDESLRSLTEFYDSDEIVSIYIYDLIAAIINRNFKFMDSDTSNEEIENFIYDLIFYENPDDIIEMEGKELKLIIDYIDEIVFSTEKLEELYEKYAIKEQMIEIEYKLNLNSESYTNKEKLIKEYDILKFELEELSKKSIKNKSR